MYRCGASTKDAGRRLAVMSRLSDGAVVGVVRGLVASAPQDGLGWRAGGRGAENRNQPPPFTYK